MASIALLRRELDLLVQTQHGLFTTTQLLKIGYSRKMIHRRIASGEWIVVFPKVLRGAATPLTYKGNVMGGVLWGASSTVASHRAAANLWELFGSWSEVIEITTPRRQSVEGITVHHSARAIPANTVDGIPVTPVDRTILDLCSLAPRAKMAAVMDDALRRRLTDLTVLEDRLSVEARSGRPGISTFRDLVEERLGKGITDSELENLFAALDRQRGWGCTHHHLFHGESGFVAEMDFAFVNEKINIETDGYDPHRGLDKFERDRERDARLQLYGWIVLRFTWRQVKDHPRSVIAQVEEALRLRRAGLI